MYPASVSFYRYKIRPRADGYEPALFLQRKREEIRLGEAVWCCPDYTAEHRGVWLTWEGGRWFLPAKQFTLPLRFFSASLLAQGLVFSPSHAKAIRDYAMQTFAQKVATTPEGVKWADEAIWQVKDGEEEGHEE